MGFENIIRIINDVVETCRNNQFCDTCPYWDKEKGECKIQMTANVENIPEMW